MALVGNQIYNLVNSICEESFGERGVHALDIRNLSAIGEEMTNNEDVRDLFTKSLINRIGKTRIRTLDVDIEFPNLLMTDFEYGAILQKIDIGLQTAQRNEEFLIGTDNFSSTLLDIEKPNVREVLYQGTNTWNCDVTIPDSLYKKSFTSAESVAGFVSGLLKTLDDSMTVKLNEVIRYNLLGFITRKLIRNRNVVHLLTEYNSLFPDTLTINDCIYSPEFNRYSGKRILDFISYLRTPSKLYNDSSWLRATPRDNMHVFMLNEFYRSHETYLSSDVFHNELVSLPLFQPVDYWQSPVNETVDGETITVGTMPTFTASSTINLTVDYVTPSGIIDYDTRSQAGVVCVLFDREAVAITMRDLQTTSFHNPKTRATTYYNSAEIGTLNDMSENGVVFVLD